MGSENYPWNGRLAYLGLETIAAWVVLDSGVLTLAELSQWINRVSSTLNTSAMDLERQAQKDIRLAHLMGKINEELCEV